jgi:uncharacterized protein (DUF2141 family)
MKHGLGLVLVAPLLLGTAGPGTDPGGQDVRIEVSGLRNTKGLVRVCMTPHKARFPECKGDGAAFTASVPAGDARQVTFTHVPPGHYAIALLHDENSNGKADRALLIPREGFGFSRDAKVVMGPPSFADAMFDVGHSPVRQAIKMRYLL